MSSACDQLCLKHALPHLLPFLVSSPAGTRFLLPQTFASCEAWAHSGAAFSLHNWLLYPSGHHYVHGLLVPVSQMETSTQLFLQAENKAILTLTSLPLQTHSVRSGVCSGLLTCRLRVWSHDHGLFGQKVLNIFMGWGIGTLPYLALVAGKYLDGHYCGS